MKCICNTCKRSFEDYEIYIKPGTADPDVGYNGDECCPFCKSDDIEEAVECECCGRAFSYDDCRNFICADCLEKEVTQDKLIACEKAHEDFVKVEIPSYFLWLLGDGNIVSELERVVTDRGTNQDARDYVADDPESFLRYRREVSE